MIYHACAPLQVAVKVFDVVVRGHQQPWLACMMYTVLMHYAFVLHHASYCSYEDWALKELIITDA
jgi:hypothetical protein